MSERSKALSRRLDAFNEEMIAFVETCSEEGWKKRCPQEDWGVGVTARHVAAGHYDAVEFAKQIVAGEPLPDLTMAQIVEMGNQHARDHAETTREEVLGMLKKNGSAVVEYAAGLSDEELDRKGRLSIMGGEVTAEQIFEFIILQSGGEHLANMRTTAGV